MNDPLAEAQKAAGEGYVDLTQRYAWVSIAQDIRRIADHITGTTPGDAR